ncbi:MAG: DUF488 domain-containing protein [Caulobacteraceae bacterium]|nr:DUF488 domain-containing protein [Caulobacteraceae bacterium]
MNPPFFTIGHSNRPLEAFAELLEAAEVGLVVDIRTVPRSRSNPDYNEDALPGRLAALGIGYEHLAELGGLRGRSKTVAPQVNSLWDNQSFHNYADYALTEAFEQGLERLVALGRARRCAMMCAEAVWWRCHRRIVADRLIARGEQVFHLMGQGRVEPARLTAGARITEDGQVVYPPAGR